MALKSVTSDYETVAMAIQDRPLHHEDYGRLIAKSPFMDESIPLSVFNERQILGDWIIAKVCRVKASIPASLHIFKATYDSSRRVTMGEHREQIDRRMAMDICKNVLSTPCLGPGWALPRATVLGRV